MNYRQLQLLVTIAWRNLSRNRRRTLIAGWGIALGVGMGIASFGVMDGMNDDMLHSVTDVQLGHVQVHEPGYSNHPKLALAFEHGDELTRRAEGLPEVAAVSPRVFGWALARTERKSVGVQLAGIDPRREAKVTRVLDSVVEGQSLAPEPTDWPAPGTLDRAQQELDDKLTQRGIERALAEIAALDTPSNVAERNRDVEARTNELLAVVAPPPKSPPGVLLGDKLAHKLQVGPTDIVTFMVSDAQGSPSSVDFRVRGIVHTGDSALDGTRALAHIEDVRHLFALPDRAHELAIRAVGAAAVAPLAERLARQPGFETLEVKTWQQLRPDVVAMLGTNSVLTALLVAIIVAAAAIGVADTVVMAVFERRREFGVLGAVGMRPPALVMMVAAETVLLSVGASLAGLVLGLTFDLLLAKVGIPLPGLSDFSLAGAAIPPVLHATVTPEGVLVPLGCMMVMALAAAVWPAWLAAHTDPVIAMNDR